MSADIELARAHFECALTLIVSLKDSPVEAASSPLLDEARMAYGAGVRRLQRVPRAPWLSDALREVSELERQVRRCLQAKPEPPARSGMGSGQANPRA
ncbi:MAG TPA: hypothetical protein VGP93_21260 [Polyangiaceae bacterium]|nr:hypothetical protein [Polyangiaceae bacterium]